MPSLGYMLLGLTVVVLGRPERLEMIFDGRVAGWRVALFLVLAFVISAVVVALSEWWRKRRG